MTYSNYLPLWVGVESAHSFPWVSNDVRPVFVQSFSSNPIRLWLDENRLDQNELDEKQVYQGRGKEESPVLLP